MIIKNRNAGGRKSICDRGRRYSVFKNCDETFEAGIRLLYISICDIVVVYVNVPILNTKKKSYR